MQRLGVQRDVKILGQRDEILRCDRLPLMRNDGKHLDQNLGRLLDRVHQAERFIKIGS